MHIVESDDAGGGQNIVLGTAGEGGEQHRPVPLIEAGGDTVKRAEGAGQRAADGAVFVVLVGAGDDAGYRQTAVGELGHAGVFIGPLDTEIEAVGILHFGDNRLHQHLRAADIQLGDHSLQIVHHVRRGGDDQGVGLAVGFDNDIFIDRGHRFGALLIVLQRAADPGQYLHQIGGFGVLQVDHFGVALHRLLAVELFDHGDNALARVWLAAHQHRVGTLIGHHVRHHRSRQRRFAGVFIEFGNQFDHLRGGGPGERHGHHAAIPGVVDAFDNSQQAFDDRRAAGHQQDVGGFIMDHAAGASVIVQLAEQRREIAGGDVGQGHHPGDDLIAFARRGLAGDRNGRGLGVFSADHLQHAVIHINHGEAVYIQHAEEELIILLFIEHIVTAHGDSAAYAGIDNHRFIQVFADGIDKFLDIGAFKTGGKFLRGGRGK